jgi:hypothetical protein
MVELLADWFAAATAYSGKWPQKGEWVWLERRLKPMTQEMHLVNATLISAALCTMGYERNVMKALSDDSQKLFDWKSAKTTLMAIKDENAANKLDRLYDIYMTG